MKNLFLLLFSTVVLFSCSTKEENTSEVENEKTLFFLDGKIDSVVHFTHESTDMLENELVLIDKDAILARMLNEDAYSDSDFDSLTYYYNSSKSIKDAKMIKDLNSYFQLKDEKTDVAQTKCMVFYRDIFKFYFAGNLVAVGKICFSCQQSSVHVYDSAFMQSMKDKKLKVLVDIPSFEKTLD
jgi:hypothetical protein